MVQVKYCAKHTACDVTGKLTDTAVALLRELQGMRLLQAGSHGGLQAEVTDFFAWVRTVVQYNPSAGWVAGVVGVHPSGLALGDKKLQDDIYARDADTWVVSPYAPFGRAKAVEGGYVLSGEWPYSTGTDHYTWTVLGGMLTNTNTNDKACSRRRFLRRLPALRSASA